MMHQSPRLLLTSLCAILLLLAPACDTTVKTDEAEVGEAIKKREVTTPTTDILAIDTAQSQITWIGAKMTGRHNGLFQIQNGELYMDHGLLTGGRIVIDMVTLRSDDKSIDEANNKKLTDQLRSADFFDVAHYPTAVFELTGIAPLDTAKQKPSATVTDASSELRIKNPTHRITGNLTIKGLTKSVSFPAKVTMEDGTLEAKANFNIDRTEWELIYRSDKSLGDQTIYPEVNIGLNIVARE